MEEIYQENYCIIPPGQRELISNGRIRLKKLLFDSSKDFSLIRAQILKKIWKKVLKIFQLFYWKSFNTNGWRAFLLRQYPPNQSLTRKRNIALLNLLPWLKLKRESSNDCFPNLVTLSRVDRQKWLNHTLACIWKLLSLVF